MCARLAGMRSCAPIREHGHSAGAVRVQHVSCNQARPIVAFYSRLIETGRPEDAPGVNRVPVRGGEWRCFGRIRWVEVNEVLFVGCRNGRGRGRVRFVMGS